MSALPTDPGAESRRSPDMGSRGGGGSADAAEVHIAAMRRRHLRSVLRIESHAVHKGWSLGLFMSELAREEGRIYLVAKVGSSVVGFAGLLFAGDDGHVTTLSVDPVWQRRRIGTRLMLVMARRAIEQGVHALTLEVRAENEPAIALYRRLGFAPAGVRKDYYAELGEDALIMWASEVQRPEYAARLASVETSLESPTIVDRSSW